MLCDTCVKWNLPSLLFLWQIRALYPWDFASALPTLRFALPLRPLPAPYALPLLAPALQWYVAYFMLAYSLMAYVAFLVGVYIGALFFDGICRVP